MVFWFLWIWKNKEKAPSKGAQNDGIIIDIKNWNIKWEAPSKGAENDSIIIDIKNVNNK